MPMEVSWPKQSFSSSLGGIMLKLIGGFFAGVIAVAVLAYSMMGSLMFNERVSP
jgi:hypothetical protein